MATEKHDQLEIETSARPVEEAQQQQPVAEVALSAPQGRTWYSFVNEDWLATVVGLILSILLVIRLLHNIP